jgi:hypothetical protein
VFEKNAISIGSDPENPLCSSPLMEIDPARIPGDAVDFIIPNRYLDQVMG